MHKKTRAGLGERVEINFFFPERKWKEERIECHAKWVLSSFLSSGLNNQSPWRVRPSYLQFTPPGKSFSRPFLIASLAGKWGGQVRRWEAPVPRRDPDCSPKCRACQPTNHSSERGTSLPERGAFSESELARIPYLCPAGPGT